MSDHDNSLNMIRTEVEEEYIEEMKQSKDKADKMFKKRLLDKENLWQQKFEEIEQEITDLNEAHRTELKIEKERIEQRLREQLRT